MQIQSVQIKNNFPNYHLNQMRATIFEQSIDFQKHMEAKKEEQVEETKKMLQKMMDGILALGEELENELTMDNLFKYKKAIRTLLKFYVENVLQTKDVFFREQRYMEKMTIVKKINKQLDVLDGEGLLSGQMKYLETLQRIGEINGLLLNLIV